jgi:hypothetical protein
VVAPLTDAVAALGQPLVGGVELSELSPGLGEEGANLGALEGDGGAFGVMLVVGVGRLGCIDDVDVRAGQDGQETFGLAAQLERRARTADGVERCVMAPDRFRRGPWAPRLSPWEPITLDATPVRNG